MNEEKAFVKANNQLEEGLNTLEEQIKRAENLAGRLGPLMPREKEVPAGDKLGDKSLTEPTHLDKLETLIWRLRRLVAEHEYVLNNFNNMI